MIELFPFQKESVAFHKMRRYSLNASEMGLGKSITSLTAAKELGSDPLVIAPTFLKGSWEREAEKSGMKIKFVPYSTLHKLDAKAASRHEVWIADEVHFCKSPTTRRTHALYGLLKECLPPYFIGMSGTPLKNKVADLWTLLAFMNLDPSNSNGVKLPKEFSKYHAFCRYFCKIEEIRVRGRKIPKYGAVRDEKIPELKALLKDKMIRYRVEDVLHDLPDLIRKPVPVSIKGALVPDLKETFDAYWAGHKVNPTAKRQSAILKAGATTEYCKELIEGGSGQLVVFTDHVEPANMLRTIAPGTKVITGATAMDERDNYVKAFQAGKIPVIVATIGSMSVGVTLTAARHVVFNDLSWVPSDNAQAEKRIHRIGQKNACVSHYIESTPTDSYINKTLISKMETIIKVID